MKEEVVSSLQFLCVKGHLETKTFLNENESKPITPIVQNTSFLNFEPSFD